MGAGRKPKYKPEYAEQAYRLCLMGLIDKELADFFEVKEQTINNWKKDYPEFFESLKKGKLVADGKVSESLYHRSLGYKHKDLYITQYQGQVIKEEIMKHYPPDTTACIFWLKNRQPGVWSDKQTTVHEIPKNSSFEIKFRNGDSVNESSAIQHYQPKAD
jgi:hypothetical protein